MKYIVSILMICSLFLTGCDYLDMVPENDIETIETIFEKREQAEEWFKSCHSYLIKEIASVVMNPAYAGTDEIVTGQYVRQTYPLSNVYCWDGLFIGDGLQMSQSPYGDIWQTSQFYTAIRYCNIFFEQIEKVYNMKQEEKDLWVAELKALKAHYYFELMRRYGPIVLIDKNVDANADVEEMQFVRRPIEECVDTIVSLCDQAMKVLPHWASKEISRQGYYSLEAAAALKAKTLFYAASPIFNGNPMYNDFKNRKGELLFPAAADKEKWRIAAEAVEEAIKICKDGGMDLVEGNKAYASNLRNTMLDIEYSVLGQDWKNQEAVFMIRPEYTSMNFWHNWTLPYFKSSDLDDYNADCMGCVSPSIKMVEMYYTENGLPINADKTWNYDKRYQLSQETNGKYKDVVMMVGEEYDFRNPYVSGTNNTKGILALHLRREPRFYAHIAADRCYWMRGKNMAVTAYQGEKFGTQSTSITTLPQNLTGYWIKKGSYSNVSTKEYTTVDNREEAFIETRLAELYLMKAEAWNEYLTAPDKEHVYNPLNEVRRRAGIPDVEVAWADFSNSPEKVTNQAGMREIIRQEWNIEFAFEGRRFWNLRRWLIAAEELNSSLLGWNILGKDADSFYNNYAGPVVVWSQRKFVAPRDYLFPLESEEVMISGCVQNPGW